MYVYIQHEWTHTQCTYARVYIQIHTYVHTCMYTLMATHGLCEYNTIHVIMRDKKEGGRKQEASKVKQSQVGLEPTTLYTLDMYIHVLMRDEKEGRKKQARSQ